MTGVKTQDGSMTTELKGRASGRTLLAVCAIALLVLTGCHTDMWIQPKVRPLAESDFFTDGQGSRPLVPNTVARGHARLDDAYYTAIQNGKLVDAFPFPIGKAEIKRGQERFNIYCSPCHGRLGDGKGFIALRGLALRRPPASFHDPKIVKLPVGHYFDVMTNGFGVMYPYASRVEPADRWKIAAYIRVLQRSQMATAADVPAGAGLNAPVSSGAGKGEQSE